MLRDLIKVEDRVEALLRKYPQCRESDKFLWLAYCVNYCELKQNLGDYDTLKAWLLQESTPVFESLSRARRKITEKNEGLHPQNYQARQQEEQAVRDWSRG